MGKLKNLGYRIKGERRKGYLLLSSPDIPYPWEIKPCGRFRRFLYFESIDSTNTRLLLLAKEGAEEGTVVIADFQTGGRGRYGRKWFSPKGNIHMSLLLRPNCTVERGGLIPILAGVASARAIERFGISVTLKWPNDLLISSKKVGGILCESLIEDGKISSVVVGIGINIRLPPERNPLIENATSLSEQGFSGKRNELVQGIIEEFDTLYTAFVEGEVDFIVEEYLKRALPRGNIITVKAGEGEIKGRFAGIERDGSLLIEEGGHIRRIYTGEVS